MSKKKAQRKAAPNEATAFLRSARVSPRKLGLVAGLIRGMDVKEALMQLTFLQKRIAKDVKKTLQSAVANAENNHNLDVDRLYVAEAHVGKSFVMKRFHARARGRAAGIKKPFSHLFITVREKAEKE